MLFDKKLESITINVIGYKRCIYGYKDVAKMANVSTATVSRIINNKPGANIETEKE